MTPSAYTISTTVPADKCRQIAAAVIGAKSNSWFWLEQPQAGGDPALRYHRDRKPIPAPREAQSLFAWACILLPGMLFTQFGDGRRHSPCREELLITIGQGEDDRTVIHVVTRTSAVQVGKAIREALAPLDPDIARTPEAWKPGPWDDRDAVVYLWGTLAILSLLPVTIGLALLYNAWKGVL